MTFRAAEAHKTAPMRKARSWSICAFPASSQPPTVILAARSTTRAADRAPQQGLGMQQRPEPYCQAAHAAVGRARAVVDGNGLWSFPNPRLNHRSSFICQWSRLLVNSGARRHYGKRSLAGDAMCGQGSAGTATVKTVPHPAEGASNSGELVVRRAGESELPVAKDHRGSSRRVRDAGPKPVRPSPLTTPNSKSGHHARAMWRTDSRPRIALLQSLVGINQSHGRMTTGVRSNHLSRCPAPHATLGQRTQLFSHAAQCGHDAIA